MSNLKHYVRTYVYLWLIRVEVRQKPTQYCKAIIFFFFFFAIIFQLKINNFFKDMAFQEKNKAFLSERTLVAHALLSIERNVKQVFLCVSF